MGYSRSPSAVTVVKQYLDAMAASSERIEWATLTPWKLAYDINNGIHAANFLQLDKYTKLKSKYIIRTQKNKVIADPREKAPMETLKVKMARVVVNDVEGALEILGAILQHKAPEMFFPDADPNSVPQLYTWASKNGYFVIPSDDGITLTISDPDDIAWRPEDG